MMSFVYLQKAIQNKVTKFGRDAPIYEKIQAEIDLFSFSLLIPVISGVTSWIVN